MISINSRGQVCHGTGGGWASVDNVPFHRGGVAGWIDDDTVLFANGDDVFATPAGGDWPASSYHVPTKQTARVLGETGMNVGYASNQGSFAFWWGTNLPGRAGLYRSNGLHLPAAGLMGVGPDGAMAYKPDYQSNGPTIVRELDGSEWQLTPNHAYSLQLLGQKQAIFADSRTGLTFFNIPTAMVLPGGSSGHRAAWADGQWWIAYYWERIAAIVLHPFDEFVGYHVSPRKRDAWFNLRALSDTLIYVPWSSRESEAPGEMTLDDSVMFDVTKDARVQLFEEAPVPAPKPPDPPVPPLPPAVPKPKVTVLAWDRVIKAGQPWHVKFQTGPPPLTTVDVSKNAEDHLNIVVWNEAGTDPTGMVRQLTVEGPDTTVPPEPPKPEPLPMLPRFIYSPSIGALDVPEVFTDPTSHLARVSAYALPVQQILTDEPTPQLGPNTWPNLVANGVVRQLRELGIPLIVEMGSIKPYDCQAKNGIADMQKAHQRVTEEGGLIFAFAMDEPLTANQWPVEQGGCHQTLEMCADAVANYIHAVHDIDPEILIGWWEAWPEVSLEDQRTFLQLLKDRNALPNYRVPDIFWDHTTDLKAAAFLAACQEDAEKFGVALCCSINSTKDPIDPDQTHYDNLITLAKRIFAMQPDVAHVIAAAWATRDTTLATQNVPNCLGQFGMIQTYHDVSAIFEVPGGEDMKSTTMIERPPIAVKQVKSVAGESGIFTLVLTDDRVYSCQPPDGTDDDRDPGTEGGYEKCTVDGNLATFCPAGEYFSRWFVRVGGL